MYPKLIEITQNIGLHSYGFMLALGFFIGIHLATKRSVQENIDPNKIIQLVFYIFIFAIIGSRLLHVVAEDLPKYLKNPLSIFYFWHGGFAYYGGFLFSIPTVYIYCKKQQWNFWKIADILTPSVALGLSFGRMGCLLAGCCYGKECDLPWAIQFPPQTLGKAGVLLHPTQTYESIAVLIIFIVLISYQNRKRFHGELFFMLMILYGVARSFIEFFRDDHRGIFFNNTISTSQLISIPLISFGAIAYLYFHQKRKKDDLLWKKSK